MTESTISINENNVNFIETIKEDPKKAVKIQLTTSQDEND